MDPFELSICSNSSFSPKEKTGTKGAFCLIARRMKPKRRLSVKSAVPGRAYNDSAAPPMTMTIERPGPEDRIFSHEERDTEAMPMAMIKSRYKGRRKLLGYDNVRYIYARKPNHVVCMYLVNVSSDGMIPGNWVEKPVASVAKLATAPNEIIP